MAITTIYTYPLNGTQRDFTIPFEYLARRFVVVTLIGANRRELTLTADFRFISKTLVQLNKAWGPSDGYERIEIRRNTSATDRLVDFADGSILRAAELNTSQVQTLHVAEEARNMVADTISENSDGDLDARGRRLVNLADATEPGHAVTLRQEQEWSGSTLASSVAAKASELAAKASETNSKASELAAKASETNSKASELAAKASETNSKASELAAKASETNSKASELAAKASETNSKASELAAKASELSLGNAVGFYSLIGAVMNGVAIFKPSCGIDSAVMRVNGAPVWHPGNFNPELKLSVVPDGKGNSLAAMGAVPAGGPYCGTIELRERGLALGATADLRWAPGITFHWGDVVVKELLMGTAGNLMWGDPSGELGTVQVVSKGGTDTNGWRKYSNGDIEQWGRVTTAAGGVIDFNFNIGFPNAVFFLQGNPNTTARSGTAEANNVTCILSTSTGRIHSGMSFVCEFIWYAKGR